MNISLEQFIKQVTKSSSFRNHKVKNSYGVYDGFKYYRKNKPKDSKYIITESQYFSIIRSINKLLIESFLEGNDIILPFRLGKLELRKYNSNISIVNNKIVTNLPIDWNKTLKLWYEDEESFKNKTLVKVEEKEIFKVFYNKSIANFNNKSFYEFIVNREFKKKIKQSIKEGKLDAFLLKK